MKNIKFKKGDKVKCLHFLYGEDNSYKETVGTFNRYNKYGDNIAYVYFGQPCEMISCFTSGVELVKSTKNGQLLFKFMN